MDGVVDDLRGSLAFVDEFLEDNQLFENVLADLEFVKKAVGSVQGGVDGRHFI